MTLAVTATLMVGEEPMQFATTRCSTATRAFNVILGGGTAQVPTMGLAADVLRLLGCDEIAVAARISYAFPRR